MSGNREPPHDVAAERAVLGTLLIGPAVGIDPFGAVAETGLDGADFYSPPHRHIFDAIATVYVSEAMPDAVLVGDELRRTGLLDDVGGIEALHELQNATPSISNVAQHAAIVIDAARRRRTIMAAADVSQAAFDGDNDSLARARDALAAALTQPGVPQPDPCRTVFVSWPQFWSKDRREAEWLYPPILARGRGHAFFAAHKVGKSLLSLDIAASLATGVAPVIAVYMDYEMGEDDVYERLNDMGYGADTDLSRLFYAVLPSLPPLDTAEGAKALFLILDATQAARPDHHLVVIIDTTGRAVAGEENSADTIRNFYRWTGLGLKQRGVTWARLDHAGKDPNRGQRGSSAKGDDVDVVWRITPADDGGLLLKREATRMSWVPERVALHRSEHPLHFRAAEGLWPAGTKEVAEVLDGLDVPLDCGERPAGQALRDAGHRRSQAIVRAALRWRRQVAEEAAR